MNKTLEHIIETNFVIDSSGEKHPLHSHISADHGQFLQDIVAEIRPQEGIEVGLAYGISTLFILDQVVEKNINYKHTVIEPFPDDWKNIGSKNIEDAGFSSMVKIIPKFSHEALPAMYLAKKRIQFAFIDSTKVFDVIFHDFYFIDKMLDLGGVIVFDDCTFPGIRKVTRFIANHPSYKIYKTHAKDHKTPKYRFAEKILKACIGALPFKKRIFLTNDFKTDEDLGVDYFSVAFQKVKQDDRSFSWNENF